MGPSEPYREISISIQILLIVEELLPIRDGGTFNALLRDKHLLIVEESFPIRDGGTFVAFIEG